jgi:hypothetical protein
MYFQNQTSKTAGWRSGWAAVTLMATVTISLYLVFPVFAAAEPSNPESVIFTSKKGLRLRVLKSSHIPFVHAQLVIYYKEKIKNPAIPYLTLLNIFDRNLKGNDTPLLSILKKLGNDYRIEHRPDFLLFKINFLPDKILLFVRFLKALYSHKPFLELNSPSGSYVDEKQKLNTQTRFKDSIANYWNYFFKQPDWKTRIAYQIAYRHWFPSAIMGQTFITPDSLKDVTLDRLRSFYDRTYQLSNSLLIIKGNIEQPGILYGHIEKIFASFKKQSPQLPVEEKLTANSENKIIVFDTNNDDSPIMFWFQVIPTYNNRNPLASLVLNNILFTYPTGRLYLNSRPFNINIFHMDTQMENHQGITVICNTIRLRYVDIRKFIVLVEKERKKLRGQQVDRLEYLNTLSNIYGRLEVNTQNFENDISLEIINIKAEYYAKKVTLASLNHKADHSNQEVIVIVGNADLIRADLGLIPSRKVEVIEFTR